MTPSERERRTSGPMSGRRTRSGPARGQGRGVAPDARRRMIAEAAYFRAEQRQFCCECDLHDWLAAEKEVDATLRYAAGSDEQESAAPTAPHGKTRAKT